MFIGSNLRITCINDIIGYLSSPFFKINSYFLSFLSFHPFHPFLPPFLSSFYLSLKIFSMTKARKQDKSCPDFVASCGPMLLLQSSVGIQMIVAYL